VRNEGGKGKKKEKQGPSKRAIWSQKLFRHRSLSFGVILLKNYIILIYMKNGILTMRNGGKCMTGKNFSLKARCE
jgi:hypothetical protein